MRGPDLNSFSDRFLSLHVRVGRRSYSAFRFWAGTGLLVAVLLNLQLAHQRGLSIWVTAASICLALCTAYASACATKILSGREDFTFFQHLISVTLATLAFMWLLGQPILLYLDINIVTVGAAAVPGRIGCLKVGCCHGRPCRFGIRYRAEHAAAGFISQLVGVRLFPIQLVECLCAAVIVTVGGFMIWQGYPPGAAAAWFFVSYSATRFCFEFARWPANYQFRSGLSPYQWISVVLLVLTSGFEFAGVFPRELWHFAIAVVVLLTTFVVVLERYLRSFAKALNHPDHVRELAHALDEVSWRAENAVTKQTSFGDIPIATTSLGLQITASTINSATGDVYHYALCSRGKELTDEIMNSLVELIAGSKRSSGRQELIKGRHGVFHVLIHQPLRLRRQAW